MRKHILTAFTALALSCTISADVLADSKHGHRDRHYEPRRHYEKHYAAPHYPSYRHSDYRRYDRHHGHDGYHGYHGHHGGCAHGHHDAHGYPHQAVAFGVVGYDRGYVDYGFSIIVRR